MNHQVIGCVAAVTVAVSAIAGVERTWVGAGADSKWTTAANWSPAAAPGSGDTVVFSQSGLTRVDIAGTCWCGPELRVEQGAVEFCAAGGYMFLGGPTSVVYVAEGAVLTNSAHINPQQANNKTGVFAKDGPGHLVLNHEWGFSYSFAGLDYRSGLVDILPAGTAYYSQDKSVLIRSGCTVRANMSYYAMGTTTRLTIEEGGVLDLRNYTTYVGSLFGSGVVTNSALQIWAKSGSSSFAGRVFGGTGENKFDSRPSGMSDDDWTFYIGASNTWANAKLLIPNGTAAAPGNTIRFEPGIGTFYFGGLQFGDYQHLDLTDREGESVDVQAVVTNPNKIKLRGAGDFTYLGSSIESSDGSTQDFSEFTGSFNVTGNRQFVFGANAAGKFPDLSSVETFNTLSSDARLGFNNGNGSPVTLPGRIHSVGGVYFNGPISVSDIDIAGGSLSFFGDCEAEIVRGTVRIGTFFRPYVGSAATLSGVEMRSAADALYENQSWSVAKRPAAVHPSSNLQGGQFGDLTLTDGSRVHWYGNMPRRLTVSNGSVFRFGSNAGASGSESDGPCELYFDGGTMEAAGCEICVYTMNVLPDSDRLICRTGPGGMTVYTDFRVTPFTAGLSQYDFLRGISGDGPFTRIGAGIVYMYRPFSVSGEFAVKDGVWTIMNTEYMTGTAEPLNGSGDFRLGAAQLAFASGFPGSTEVRLGTGANSDGRFTFEGCATVRLRPDTSSSARKLRIGELVLGGAASALFLQDPSTSFAAMRTEGGSVVSVTAPATNADGRVTLPIFSRTVPSVRAMGRVGFLSYGENGFEEFTNAVAIGEVTAGQTASVKTMETLDKDVTLDALEILAMNSQALTSWNSCMLTVPSGKTLSFGPSSVPAVVIFTHRDGWNPSRIGGAGTIDFGDREGMLITTGRGGGIFPAGVAPVITGRGGLSLVAPADRGEASEIVLRNANSYSGGTRVIGAIARPENSRAFSTGTVYLGNSEFVGGAIRMDVEGLVIDNAVVAGGYGTLGRWGGDYDTAVTSYDTGAIYFTKSGELSGPLTAAQTVRLSAKLGAVGTFSGKVSGGRVVVWRTADGAKVVFTNGDNSYTGGTEVVSATLCLKGAGTVGTGRILLDNGVLELEGEEEKTVENEIGGVGTVRLSGKGAVTLANAKLDSGFTLDLTKKVSTINSLDGFSKITTGRTQPTHLIVADGKGKSFAGEVPENVTIYDPGEYTPPGLTLILR